MEEKESKIEKNPYKFVKNHKKIELFEKIFLRKKKKSCKKVNIQ